MVATILKKIFNNLIRPHKIPIKIISKLNYYKKYKEYNKNLFEAEQNRIFKSIGLEREKGLENLNFVKKKLISIFDTDRGMSSEHEVLFSSLSVIKNQKISDILEIGTFDGVNSFLLSNLFPKSNVDTIDLHETDEDFINFYDRKNKIKDFINNRNKVLVKNSNINFFHLNSLKLLNHKKKYDLIWIDGAHGYPTVSIDIINSLNMIKDNGIILCDDVVVNLNHINSDRMYSSIASFETLNALQKQNLIKFNLIYKRLNAEDNCIENKRKFIAFVKKI